VEEEQRAQLVLDRLRRDFCSRQCLVEYYMIEMREAEQHGSTRSQ
jgi:hypothetical protein